MPVISLPLEIRCPLPGPSKTLKSYQTPGRWSSHVASNCGAATSAYSLPASESSVEGRSHSRSLSR